MRKNKQVKQKKKKSKMLKNEQMGSGGWENGNVVQKEETTQAQPM